MSKRTNPFDALLAGEAQELRLTGSPPSSVLSNLRKLKQLELLEPSMVWAMMAQVEVDPLCLIFMLRAYKPTLGLEHEEHVVNDTLTFVHGVKTEHGYTTVCQVNIFTNDVQVMTLRDGTYHMTAAITAEALYEKLSTVPAGPGRLEKLLKLFRGVLGGSSFDLQ